MAQNKAAPQSKPVAVTPYAVAFTSEPVDRLWRKLFSADCAELTSPELSAEPICFSMLANELVSEEDVLLDVLVSDVPVSELLLVAELPSSRLVRLS